jgi:hypothetical protein
VIILAMTDDELMLQMNILASKTESNPNMPYKSNATLNKGLNPEFFTGNSTKIVNAINDLASKANNAMEVSQNVANKVNEILLDTSMSDNIAIWENVKDLMGKETIIEGIEAILQGKQVDKVLGLNVADQGKVLSIDVDDQGKAVLKAIDMIASEPQDLTALNISYTNSKVPTVKNVKTALDNIFTQLANGNTGGGELGGGVIVGEITWDMIDDKPNIGSKLSMTAVQGRLALLDENNTVISNVPLTTDSDIEEIINNFKNESEEE